MSVRITKLVVDRMSVGSTVWDSELKGFGVRRQRDQRSFVLKTQIGARQAWMTIGRYGPWTTDSARQEARRLLGDIAKGLDPRRKPEANVGLTVSELCGRYLTEYAEPRKKPSSVKLDRMNIRNHIEPLLGKQRAADVTANAIEKFKVAVRNGETAPADLKAKQRAQGGGVVVRGGSGVANRCLTLLSTIFSQAEAWGLRPKGSNPVAPVARYREAPKERFLSNAEFERLGEVLAECESADRESPHAIAAIRLLILTGARLSEILTLRWDWVQLDRQLLRLPDSKTGAKNVLLPAEAVELLQNLPRMDGNPFVIVGGKEGHHLVDLQRPWQRIRKAAGLSDVRIHDLRHSFASLAIQNGVSLSVIGKLLGHRSSETTKRYAHLEDSYLSGEADRIGSLLSTALSPRAD